MTTGRKTQGIKITMQTASITIEHHRTAQKAKCCGNNEKTGDSAQPAIEYRPRERR